jgi:hypothetical protein
MNFQTEANSSCDLERRRAFRNDNAERTLTLLLRVLAFTMKLANKLDDRESLPVSDNHILAIITDREEAKVIVETLPERIFS